MRSELQHVILTHERADLRMAGQTFESSVFLDSEDLIDLTYLRQKVLQSHNLLLLLTEGVLTRPWCLAEVVIANKYNIPIILVEVKKTGTEFTFPDEAWYRRLLDGKILSKADLGILRSCQVTLSEVAVALRATFNKIAVPYSPHRPVEMRHVEVKAMVDRCIMWDSIAARNAEAKPL